MMRDVEERSAVRSLYVKGTSQLQSSIYGRGLSVKWFWWNIREPRKFVHKNSLKDLKEIWRKFQSAFLL